MWWFAVVGMAQAAPEMTVLAEVPARTPAVRARVRAGQLGWGTTLVPLESPDRYLLYGGVAGKVVVRDRDTHDLLLDAGLQSWKGRWETGNFDLQATVWDARLDLAWRADLTARTDVPRGYATVGAGGQITVFDTLLWATRVNPSLHSFAGFGVRTVGKTAFVAEIRTSAAMRVDYYGGEVDVSEGVIVWRYHPGSLSVSVLAGAQF